MAGSVIQGEHAYMKQTPTITNPCRTYPEASSITSSIACLTDDLLEATSRCPDCEEPPVAPVPPVVDVDELDDCLNDNDNDDAPVGEHPCQGGLFDPWAPDEDGLDRLTRLRRLTLRMDLFVMEFASEVPTNMTTPLTADEREAQSIVVRDACAIVTAIMSPITCFVCPTCDAPTEQ